MTTTSHVLAACGSLRTAWSWLATATTPGNARRNQPALSARAVAKRNERAAEERADRPHLTNASRIVGGGQPPANLGAIDARTRIADNVDQLAAELSLAVATVRKVGGHYTNSRSSDAKFTSALDWISSRAQHLNDPHLINDAYRRLTANDKLARSIVGEGPAKQRFATSCPACGRRSLYWDVSSIEHRERFVGCDNPACLCRGRDCACKVPDRQPGTTHVWLESAWNRLAQQLKESA